ncbi:uncharacterized protein LOC126373234 [Pectinophora gossypiella]|uniref:uncharacterized protein LOC126373234 n=1 Tax=Pectinophora gossypiella TaxID=13191 RepID=UPI00214E1C47|nr:uncharacterized protein LOC126373234 [Pectinophora gossypiella]
MKSIITLLLLWVCSASSEPLGAAIQRRSSRNGVYAREYAQGYDRVSYVAIPLHAPLPVLHVLSPTPLYRPNRAVHRIPEQPRVYAASMPHAWYSPPPAPMYSTEWRRLLKSSTLAPIPEEDSTTASDRQKNACLSKKKLKTSPS